jgi:imidazolonepropionase-like amidohydrolase
MIAHALRFGSLVVALLALVFAGTLSKAQPSTNSPIDPPPNGPRKSDPSHHVLTNCVVHVSPTQTIEQGAVEFNRGRIVSVTETKGKDFVAPVGARVWDMSGMHVYAGFIDSYVEVEARRPEADAPGVHWSAMVTPQRSALDGDGVDGKTAEGLRALGFTAAAISPMNAGTGRGGARAGGIFRGTSAVVSLAKPEGDRSDGRPPVYLPLAYHSVAFELARPNREGDQGWQGYPDSQMGAIAIIRQTLLDAQWQAVGRMNGTYREATNAVDALIPQQTAGGEAGPAGPMMLFNTDDELEAQRAAKIAREFNRKAAILGCGTEFRRLDAIVQDKLPIVLPLNYPKEPDVSTLAKAESTELRDMMTWEQAPTNARRLDAAGVPVVLTTAKLRDRGEFSANLKSAIKHGLKPERALAMLTTQPAALLGVGSQMGTIEPGKLANLVVASGDLFEPEAKGDGKADAKPEGKPEGRAEGKAAKKASGKTKIHDVWIDGKRFENVPMPEAAFAGTWDLKLAGMPEAAARMTFSEDVPPKVTVTAKNEKGKWKSAEASKIAVQGKTVSFVFDHDDFGPPEAAGVASTTVLFDGSRLAKETDTISGTVVVPGGQAMAFTGTRRAANPLDGVWQVTEADGKAIAPDSKEGVSLTFKDDALTVTFTDKDGKPTAVEAEGVKIDGASGSFEHSLKPLNMEGVSKDTFKVEGDVLVGSSVLPDNSTHAYKAKLKAAKKDKDEEKDDEAIKSIPEKLGYPFGPYQRASIPEQPEFLVLRGATVWTANATGEILKDAAVVIRKGKIEAVLSGPAAAATDYPGATVVTLPPGTQITPGIIDCHSHTGISKGVNESGQAVTAEVRIQDVTDPDAISWYRQLAGGVTAVSNLHGSANTIGGQNCVNRNRWGVTRADEMHFDGVDSYSDANPLMGGGTAWKTTPGIKFALGENVKQSNWGDRYNTRYPQTRMGVETLIRDRFTAAREYIGAWEAYAKNPQGTMPRRDLELEALAEILKDQRLIHCHSYRQDEIQMLARLCKSLGFKLGTFQHILEGYKVADEIRENALGASCFSDWWAFKVEVQDAIPQAGPIMWEEGVVVSFNSDSDELARRMNLEAAKAVRYSSDQRPITPGEAIKFVTINPAKQLKIDGRVGSIEAGKDADLAVWSGDPLSVYSKCVATYIEGRQYFSVEQDEKDRATISAERQRLIQKLLSKDKAKKKGKGEKGEGKGDEKPDANPEAKPTYPAVDDARRAYYLQLMQRGLDPMAARSGDCGLCNQIGAN